MEIVTTSTPVAFIRDGIKTKTAKEITKTEITTVIDLPAKPYIGMQFGTYGTNSVATVENIHGSNIQYSYSFDPEHKFMEPYKEVRAFSFLH